MSTTITDTLVHPVAESQTLSRDVLATAVGRVADYLVRSGWGQNPAQQRAERLVGQTWQNGAQRLGDPARSAADLNRLVRESISVVCQSQCDQAAANVIRPVLGDRMQHPMVVRKCGPLRLEWWTNRLTHRR